MKIQTLLGLCLSASLLLASPAMADKNKGKGNDKPKNARAMQVQLDKKTGKIMNEADDSELNVEVAEAETIVDAKGMMPVKSEPAQYHADGSISVKLGTEHLEYLVVTVGESGEKALSHQKEESLNLKHVELDKGER